MYFSGSSSALTTQMLWENLSSEAIHVLLKACNTTVWSWGITALSSFQDKVYTESVISVIEQGKELMSNIYVYNLWLPSLWFFFIPTSQCVLFCWLQYYYMGEMFPKKSFVTLDIIGIIFNWHLITVIVIPIMRFLEKYRKYGNASEDTRA